MVPKGVPYPMLSDAGGAIGKVYGVYDEASGVTPGDASSSTRTASSRPGKCSPPRWDGTWPNSPASSRPSSMSGKPGR